MEVTIEQLLALHGNVLLTATSTAGTQTIVPFTVDFTYTYENIIQAQVVSSNTMDVIQDVTDTSNNPTGKILGFKYTMSHNKLTQTLEDGTTKDFYLVCPADAGVQGFFWVCKCNDKANYLFTLLESGLTEQDMVNSLLANYPYITRTEAREGITFVLDLIQPSRLTTIENMEGIEDITNEGALVSTNESTNIGGTV